MKTGLREPAVTQGPDDRAGHRPDVGPAVAPDLGLVPHPADRDPLELAAEGPGDRLAEAGLADARRADEAEDRPGRLRIQLAHGQVLEDPVLDLLHVVVVLVEDLFGVVDVEVVFGLVVPGQVDEPLEIGADDTVLGRGRRQLLQPGELAFGCLKRLLRQPGFFDPLAEFIGLGHRFVFFPEFGLDRLQLLPQEVLALALVDRRLDLGLDLGTELDHLELAGEDPRQHPQPLRDVDLLEQRLLLLGRDSQGPGDQV